MTKEEAIKILYEMEYKTAYSGELGGLAVEMAVEALRNQQPSLPSNLDEAAMSRMRDPDMYLSDAVIGEMGDELLKMAHFGAEWMAGQGVKATATVGYYNQSGLSILTEPSIKKLGFKEGDELEITIRKK